MEADCAVVAGLGCPRSDAVPGPGDRRPAAAAGQVYPLRRRAARLSRTRGQPSRADGDVPRAVPAEERPPSAGPAGGAEEGAEAGRVLCLHAGGLGVDVAFPGYDEDYVGRGVK